MATDELKDLERETLTLFDSGRYYTHFAVTVPSTFYHIQDKLGVGTKQEPLIWAVRNGLVEDVVMVR